MCYQILRHSDFTKFNFGRGSTRTPLGELTTLPQIPSQLGRGIPLSIPHTLDAFGVSLSTLSLSSLGAEVTK